MSRDALVDLITKEVLSVVKKGVSGAPAAGVSSAPASSSGPAASSASVSASSGPASGVGDNPLFVVTGNHLGSKDAIKLFAELRKLYTKPAVLLSHAAVRLFEDAKRPFAGFTLDPKARDFAETVAQHSSLVVINTSVNIVAKLAQLVADTPTTIALFNALKAGKPVIVTTDGLLPWYFNGGVTAKIQGYLKEIASFGIQVVGYETLTDSASPTVQGNRGPLPSADTDCGECPWAGHCATLCPDRVTAITDVGATRFGAIKGMAAPTREIGRMIDHTLLKPDATEADVRKLCEEARRYNFASVCVNPSWVKLSKQLLTGTRVMVCTVVGFPLGATSPESKAAETHQAVMDGADEIDMVINVGALKSHDNAKVLEDIKSVVRAAQRHTVKVILEVGLLNDEEKKRGCELSVDAGAHFVKTSTGFGPGGATAEDIALMRRIVGPNIGVKASGGVRDYETAAKMIKAGASRIGASASVAIVKGSRGEKHTGGDAGYGYGGNAPKPATTGAGGGGPGGASASSCQVTTGPDGKQTSACS